jgi:hypothetical protein
MKKLLQKERRWQSCYIKNKDAKLLPTGLRRPGINKKNSVTVVFVHTEIDLYLFYTEKKEKKDNVKNSS